MHTVSPYENFSLCLFIGGTNKTNERDASSLNYTNLSNASLKSCICMIMNKVVLLHQRNIDSYSNYNALPFIQSS